ncbi:MAG: hypothetical protein ACK5PF_07290, partial [bacterium]
LVDAPAQIGRARGFQFVRQLARGLGVLPFHSATGYCEYGGEQGGRQNRAVVAEFAHSASVSVWLILRAAIATALTHLKKAQRRAPAAIA